MTGDIAHRHFSRVEKGRTREGLSRVEIAEQTGLSAQTVSNVSRRLLDAGIIRVAGIRIRGVGKPRTLLQLYPSGHYAVGVHIDPAVITMWCSTSTGRFWPARRCELRLPPTQLRSSPKCGTGSRRSSLRRASTGAGFSAWEPPPPARSTPTGESCWTPRCWRTGMALRCGKSSRSRRGSSSCWRRVSPPRHWRRCGRVPATSGTTSSSSTTGPARMLASFCAERSSGALAIMPARLGTSLWTLAAPSAVAAAVDILVTRPARKRSSPGLSRGG